MPLVVWIALGGALGAAARYGIGSWMYGWAGSALPWGTLAVNAVGSFLLGVCAAAFEALPVPGELRVAVTVGFLGAFTTFSTYSFETWTLLQQGEWARAAGYALGSLFLGVVLVVAGFAAAHSIGAR